MIKIETLPADRDLAGLLQHVHLIESAGWQLLSLSVAQVGNRWANLATFRDLPLGQMQGDMAFLAIPNSLDLPAIQQQASQWEATNPIRLVGIALVYLLNQPANIAMGRPI